MRTLISGSVLEGSVAGERPVLLLVDFQRWIIDRFVPATGPTAARRADEIAQRVRAGGGLVVHVRFVAGDGSDGGDAAPATQIIAEVTVDPTDHVLVKSVQSAFAGTGLTELLASEGITVVLVAGVVAEGGVAATVLDAMGLGFRTVIAVDAIRGVSAASERAAIETMLAAGAHALE